MALAPWCSNEKWAFWTDDKGKRFAKVTGRQPCPSDLKSDYFWWLRNDYEQNLAEAPWYRPGASTRGLTWAFRNPFQNYRLFVIGCADKNYTVEVLEGNPDPMVVQRNDVGETGYQRARLFAFEDGSADRFFTSYSGSYTWQLGCQPSGFYGVKLNF